VVRSGRWQQAVSMTFEGKAATLERESWVALRAMERDLAKIIITAGH
jgi:hypothetical protein